MDLPRVEAEGGVVIPKSRPVLKRNREVRQGTMRAAVVFFPLTVRYLPQVGQAAGDDVGCSFLECRVCPSPREIQKLIQTLDSFLDLSFLRCMWGLGQLPRRDDDIRQNARIQSSPDPLARLGKPAIRVLAEYS